MPLNPLHADRLPLIEGIPSFDEAARDPALMQRIVEFFAEDDGYEPPSVATAEHTVACAEGDVRVREYTPAGAAEGALVWAHGGGFVRGDIDMREADGLARELAHRSSIVVVSVDYALSGDGVGYPTPHRQLSAALDWARDRAAVWGLPADRVALGGASAGGNLAFGATAERVAEGLPLPERLVLAYPTVHRVARSSERVEAVTGTLPPLLRFTPADVERMYADYAAGATDTPYLSADGRSLRGFPPLIVIVDEYDDLRVSGEDLAEQARREGVPTVVRMAEGMLHGHFNRSPRLPVVEHDLAFIGETLRTRAIVD